jgi:hypothetical protein
VTDSGVVAVSDPTSGFRANLPAADVDVALRRALTELQRAERNAVLWFAEIASRGLYRNLGYSSIHQYAAVALGFSSNRTNRFLRLAADLERLPRLRAAVAVGEIGWTKAREVVKVASARTEERWIAAAKELSRRELEEKVARVRRHRAATQGANPAQAEIGARSRLASSAGATEAHSGNTRGPEPSADLRDDARMAARFDDGAPVSAGLDDEARVSTDPDDDAPVSADLVDDAPVSVVFRLNPLQLARYEALIERVRKCRVVTPDTTREEILLIALDQLLVSSHGLASDEANGPNRGEDAVQAGDGTPSSQPEPRNSRQLVNCCNPGNGDRKPAVSPRSEEAGGNGQKQSSSEPRGSSPGPVPRGTAVSNYKIIVYRCEACQTGVVHTQRGPRRIAPSQMAAISCDAIIEHSVDRSGGENQRSGPRKGRSGRRNGGESPHNGGSGKPNAGGRLHNSRIAVRNQATISPSVRRVVLSRDRHQCRAAGCGNTRFLEVHHIVPREKGGSNRPQNLVTLCSRCHQLWHERGLDGRMLTTVRCRE